MSMGVTSENGIRALVEYAASTSPNYEWRGWWDTIDYTVALRGENVRYGFVVEHRERFDQDQAWRSDAALMNEWHRVMARFREFIASPREFEAKQKARKETT